MRIAYWSGFAAAAMIFLCIFYSIRGPGLPNRLLSIDQRFVDLSIPWLLPGQTRSFSTQLTNHSTSEAMISELQFSCPCATGTISGSEQMPVKVSAGESVPVRVTVRSQGSMGDTMHLQYEAIGSIDGRRVSVNAGAAVRFVQNLNSSVPLISLGQIDRKAGKIHQYVDLWYPSDGKMPSPLIRVESDDPCLVVGLERLPSPIEQQDGTDRRVVFARVLLSIDPQIAPSRMKVHAIVRSGEDDLRIPILAFVGSPSEAEFMR